MAKTASGTRSQRSRSVAPSQKAYFHQISGAGRSHVKREFFGLSPADESAIESEVGLAIDVNLRRTEGNT